MHLIYFLNHVSINQKVALIPHEVKKYSYSLSTLPVEVTGFRWPDSGHGLLAICRRNEKTYRVDIDSLEWIEPLPEGYQWIAAYQAWRKAHSMTKGETERREDLFWQESSLGA